MLGILVLDTAFPRIAGDVGAEATFSFPVRHAVVQGAGVEAVVHAPDAQLIPRFEAAARRLEAEGCVAITSTCGFLAAWQDRLAAAVNVPVLASALLQWPLVQRALPAGRRAGIVTYSATALTPAVLESAGIAPGTPIAGVDAQGYFAATIRNGADTLDPGRMCTDVVIAARTLAARHHDLGALVLECANMPPYARAVARAVGLPVFDAVDLISWFHAAASRGRGMRDDRGWSVVPP